jgi:hypothetical protein
LAGIGNVVGAGTLAGVSTISIAALGNIYSPAFISGFSALALNASGTATDPSYLAGTAALFLQATGAVVAPSYLLAGNSTVSIQGTGNLDLVVPIFGNAFLSVGATGTLSLTKYIAGDAFISIAASGLAAGLGALAGNASVAFLAEGVVIAPSYIPKDIAEFALGGSGTLTNGAASASLSGNAQIGIAAQGTLSGGKTYTKWVRTQYGAGSPPPPKSIKREQDAELFGHVQRLWSEQQSAPLMYGLQGGNLGTLPKAEPPTASPGFKINVEISTPVAVTILGVTAFGIYLYMTRNQADEPVRRMAKQAMKAFKK